MESAPQALCLLVRASDPACLR